VKQYYVYIMSSHRGVVYLGVTSDLIRRVYTYREGRENGFTKKYNVTKLVYYETTSDVHSALAREKQIKGWVRKKKLELIESMNPSWVDLASSWVDSTPSPPDPSPPAQGDNKNLGPLTKV